MTTTQQPKVSNTALEALLKMVTEDFWEWWSDSTHLDLMDDLAVDQLEAEGMTPRQEEESDGPFNMFAATQEALGMAALQFMGQYLIEYAALIALKVDTETAVKDWRVPVMQSFIQNWLSRREELWMSNQSSQ